MNVLAIITCYNEADILPWTVRHLRAQGCYVHVLDCRSTDDSSVLAQLRGATCELVSAPPVSWKELLTKVEQVSLTGALNCHYDWTIHCDADELRYSDTAGERLVDALARVDSAGCNAVNHRVLTFHPIDNGFDGSQDPATYFRHFERDAFNERIGQIKAWKNDVPVEMAWSGGHRIRRRDGSPVKVYNSFVSRHYPIRSQQHGERKVFRERQWLDQQQGRTDWHVQYQGIKPGHNFLKDPATLQELPT